MKVRSGDEGDIIKCDIANFDPDEHPVYRAVSYTWGTPKICHQILANGKQFTVRDNLFVLLCHLRRKSDQEWFWIDAICIDQNYIQERNHQVGLMANIYRGADAVIIWLGEAADDSDLAKRFLARCGSNRRPKPPQSLFSEEEIVAVSKRWRRRYWKRVWVIQEIVLARDIEVRCGNLAVSRTAFENLDDAVREEVRDACLPPSTLAKAEGVHPISTSDCKRAVATSHINGCYSQQ
jgi:hypothetical protein